MRLRCGAASSVDQHVLRAVRVLVLVDHDVVGTARASARARRDAPRAARTVFRSRSSKSIAFAIAEAALVLRIDLRRCSFSGGVAAVSAYASGRDQLVLGRRDAPDERRDREALRVDVEARDDRGEHALAVVLVVDGERRAVADAAPPRAAACARRTRGTS